MLAKKQMNKKACSAHAARMSGARRREQITEVAARVFAERGFSGTTTKDIALAAGISEASLFQHFRTKSELYTTILENKAKGIYESGWLAEVGGYAARGEDEKVFRAIALKIIEHCRVDPNFIRLMLYTALERHENAQPFRRRMLYPVFELLRDYIEKRKSEGFFQAFNAEAAAFAFIGTQVYYAMGNCLFESKMLTVGEDEAVSNFIKLTIDGLRRNAPRENAPKNDFARGEN
jgi:AcrR family transcriptional regulator